MAGNFGPPSCGKTTVARCIAGLERLATGFCVIDGKVRQDETTFRAPHLRSIGDVFKEACLFPHLSVRRNLLYAAPKCKPRPIAFDEVTELLGIASLLDHSPAHLSASASPHTIVPAKSPSDERTACRAESLRQARDFAMS